MGHSDDDSDDDDYDIQALDSITLQKKEDHSKSKSSIHLSGLSRLAISKSPGNPSNLKSPRHEDSKHSLQESKRIEAYLKAEKKKYDQFKEEPKLLILGTSDSGKSTFLKQLKILHGKGFTPEEFKVAKQNAISNILTISEQILLKCEQEIQEEYSSLLGFISNVDGPYDGLPLQLINSIKTLWNSEQFQNIYISSQYDYPLTSPHFFNEISRIADPESTMTNNDVLLLRTVTQSISDSVFEISGFKVHFYDVSGLKHHRKHWIPYFDDVNCVVFVVNIAAFDQPMAEDPSKNQMEDAISLFNRICNNPLLIKSQMMLFFNKKDVYAEKVKRINISTFFPDYQGKPQSYSEGIEFFKSKFISLNKTPRNFLIHTTCCTDTNAMNAIASSLLKNLLERSMVSVGLPTL